MCDINDLNCSLIILIKMAKKRLADSFFGKLKEFKCTQTKSILISNVQYNCFQ